MATDLILAMRKSSWGKEDPTQASGNFKVFALAFGLSICLCVVCEPLCSRKRESTSFQLTEIPWLDRWRIEQKARTSEIWLLTPLCQKQNRFEVKEKSMLYVVRTRFPHKLMLRSSQRRRRPRQRGKRKAKVSWICFGPMDGWSRISDQCPRLYLREGKVGNRKERKQTGVPASQKSRGFEAIPWTWSDHQ